MTTRVKQPSLASGTPIAIGLGSSFYLIAAVASGGFALVTMARSSGTGWGDTQFVVVIGAWAVAALAAREELTKKRRKPVVIVAALVVTAAIMPLQDSGGLHWSSTLAVILMMAGRIVSSPDSSDGRRFLVLAIAVWLWSVAWEIFPVADYSANSLVHMVTVGTVLWVGVLMVGSISHARRVGERQYRGLFEGAPVGLFEEDFSAVGPWLESIPATSADEIRDHLNRHPDETMAAVAAIKIGAVNPTALAMFGAESREVYLHGKPARSMGLQSTIDAFVELFVTIWEGRQSFDIAFVGSKVNGDSFPARLGTHFPTTADGRLDLAHGVVAITDLSPLMNALQSSDDLLVGLSHRLRTPLTGVLGFTDQLIGTLSPRSELEDAQLLGLIADEAESMAETIEDLLVAGRQDGASPSMRMTQIEMAPFLANLSARLHIGSGKHLRFGDCDLTICGDPTRLGQVLRNLIDNAATHGGPEITIETGTVGGAPAVIVADNGPPIPEDHSEVIFEPYRRIGGDPNQPRSLGLGLTIARRLARAMGGDVTYRRRRGRTEFVLLLPSPEASPPWGEPVLSACPGCPRQGTCVWGRGPVGDLGIGGSVSIKPAA